MKSAALPSRGSLLPASPEVVSHTMMPTLHPRTKSCSLSPPRSSAHPAWGCSHIKFRPVRRRVIFNSPPGSQHLTPGAGAGQTDRAPGTFSKAVELMRLVPVPVPTTRRPQKGQRTARGHRFLTLSTGTTGARQRDGGGEGEPHQLPARAPQTGEGDGCLPDLASV